MIRTIEEYFEDIEDQIAELELRIKRVKKIYDSLSD